MPSKNERAELEMKIMKYRALARNAPDEVTRQRISTLVSELEQKLREMTSKARHCPYLRHLICVVPLCGAPI
jgi:hypothetical protein